MYETEAASRQEDEKAALRRQMRAIRRAIPHEKRRARGDELAATLLSLPELTAAESVLAYSSFGTELPTDALVAALHDRGVTVLLPYLEAGEMFASVHRPGDALVPSSYGPLEPAHLPSPPGGVDAVIVPGLAFDRSGGRLGYGGGHYDRYLRQLPGHAVAIGVAFAEQVLDSVPAGANDAPVHMIVSDRELIRCPSPAATSQAYEGRAMTPGPAGGRTISQ